MMICAVVGNPISHSLSPWIHQQFASQAGISLAYEKIQGDDAGFERQVLDFFDKGGLGLNITAPFKIRAYAMANRVTERAAEARAANTLWVQENQLHADNTDGVCPFFKRFANATISRAQRR